MTAHQAIGTAVRLFAIWLVVLAIQAVGIGQALQSQSEQRTVLPYVFAALYFVVAVLLWLFPMLVAAKLVPRTKFEGTMSVPSSQVVLVACVVLGLWVIVSRALPSLAAYISLAAFWIANGQKVTNLDAARHIDGLVGLVMLGVGLVLVFKAEAVAARVPPAVSSRRVL
jgi:hypothetical protein